MLPVLAIVGRPNVGKSTLFNCFTRSKTALVADQPGLTIDRIYGEAHVAGHSFIAIDTAGLTIDEQGIDQMTAKQAMQAVIEADAVLFVVDAHDGLTIVDEQLANKLRRMQKPIFVVVNKTDGLEEDSAIADFYSLGFEKIYPIAAVHRKGIAELITEVFKALPEALFLPEQVEHKGIKVAFVGRPNVGKSTLVNRILGEERVVVYDQPGTTRDSIFIPFQRHNEDYVLIDTAGVRKRGKIVGVIEKFSIIKTLQAIEAANVAVLLIDAQEGIVEQDLHLLDFIISSGKCIVIAVNKWDGLSEYERNNIRRELERRLVFINFADIHFISALHGSGVGNIFKSIINAYKAAMKELPTPLLTRILQQAVAANEPPMIKGRRIKLRYAHTGGHNPPLIVIHGTQTEQLPESYRKYLEGYFRKALKLVGTPLRIELRTGKNPYENRKNILTPRQKRKRKRLLRHVKKK